jgi:integrase
MKVTVRQRGKRWNWQVPVYQNGARRFLSGTTRTKAEAQRAGAAALADYESGRDTRDRDKARVTVETYLTEMWLPAMRSELRPSTWTSYESVVRGRIVPRIGGVLLRDLTVTTIKTDVREHWLHHGGRAGSGLSPQSVKNTLRVLGRALHDAVAEGYIVSNPARAVSSPSTKDRAEMRTWSAADARRFDEATAGDQLGIAYHLALTGGLRRGEVLGLRWDDIDLDSESDTVRLSVRRSRVAAGYEEHEGAPKSGRSRTIALGAGTVARLKAWKRVQLEQHVARGLSRPQCVVTREDGSRPHSMTLSYYFDQAVGRVGVARIRFHDLRHTSATLLLEAGVNPKVVQERLGHANIAITLDLYSHVSPHMQDDAAARLDAAIYGD